MAKITTKNTAAKAAEPATSKGEVAVFHAPRLPYHDAVKERFDVDKGQWNVLVGAIFPAAKTVDSIVMALAYCKHRNLDIFKRPVHIVPMWNSEKGETVETIWPGISELRTTASRTGQYAGCDEAEWGEYVTTKFTGRAKQWDSDAKKMAWQDIEAEVTYPEWCRITVWRIIGGQRCKFVGPKVLWTESCATIGNSDVPNKMWQERPEGQLEKCAEAAALRRAFPEDIGNELTAEEMTGRTIQDVRGDVALVAVDAAAKDNGPPRQVQQEIIPPTGDKTPPRGTAKPEAEHLPDAEVDEPEDEQQEEEQEQQQDEPEDNDNGPMNAKATPHLISGDGHTIATWSDAYIEHIEACESAPEVYHWIEANKLPVQKLQGASQKQADRVKNAIALKLKTFRPGMDDAPKADAPKATEKPKSDSAPPRSTKPKTEKPSDGLPARPAGHDPEEFLKWVEAMLATVTDPHMLEEFYTLKVEPHIENLMPPDRAECVALYAKREKQIEPPEA